MPGKNENKDVECEGMRRMLETDRSIERIEAAMVIISAKALSVSEDSIVNRTSLEFMTETLKALAKDNTLTHNTLFGRTEDLKIDFGKLETSHNGHIEHDNKADGVTHNRNILLISVIAICVSMATAAILAYQAGIFNGSG